MNVIKTGLHTLNGGILYYENCISIKLFLKSIGNRVKIYLPEVMNYYFRIFCTSKQAYVNGG